MKMKLKVFRRLLSSEWVTNNPILTRGEVGLARDTRVLKIGDGATRWRALPGYAPSTARAPQPENLGHKAWAYDPAISTATSIVAGQGTLHLTALWNNSSEDLVISSASLHVFTAAVGLTNVGVGIWRRGGDGALLTSSVNVNGATAAAFQTVGHKVVTFDTHVTIAPGESFYVGFWFTGTTLPTLLRASANGIWSNIGAPAPTWRYASAASGLTTTPPATVPALTMGTLAWWVGVA